jgi:hypothetical protein
MDRFYNLENIPARQNFGNSAKRGNRELVLARRWQREELLSVEVLTATARSAT